MARDRGILSEREQKLRERMARRPRVYRAESARALALARMRARESQLLGPDGRQKWEEYRNGNQA